MKREILLNLVLNNSMICLLLKNNRGDSKLLSIKCTSDINLKVTSYDTKHVLHPHYTGKAMKLICANCFRVIFYF